MIKTCLDNVRQTTPLVHNITNYVTVNDVANVLLASGGSPIMSDEPLDQRHYVGQRHDSTADNKIKLTLDLADVAMLNGNVGEPSLMCHILRHPEFLADAVH